MIFQHLNLSFYCQS